MLTIVSITKNDYLGIAKTIESTSVFRSKYGVRHIIVDSSDNEDKSKVISRVKDEDNCRYIFCKNPGISNAFNYGISESNSKWIWFLNGGDYVNANIEPSILMSIIGSTSASVVVFQILTSQDKVALSHPPLWDLWPLSVNWIPHPATIIRKELFNKYGLFDTSFSIAMDGAYWLNVLSQKVVVDMISIPLAIYDQTGISSVEVIKTRAEQNRAVMSRFLRLIQLWLYSGTKIFYQNKLLHTFKNLIS